MSCSEGPTGPEGEIHVKFHVEVAHLMKNQRICGRAVYFMTYNHPQPSGSSILNHQPWQKGREELEANLALRCAGSIWSQPCWGPLGFQRVIARDNQKDGCFWELMRPKPNFTGEDDAEEKLFGSQVYTVGVL